VIAVRILGELGDRSRQSLFLRTIAERSVDPEQRVLAVQLARELNRPDLGVQVARTARRDGVFDLVDAGYPKLPLAQPLGSQWTITHAITRQESLFNREAVSRVNARGLMQLMPATAQQTASKVGVAYDYQRLTSDIDYNVLLGSSYFAQLMDYYAGSYVLAVAAYNGGMGNVNKWIRAKGDPRLPGVDVLDWIEAIPLPETRGYVQRVLENAVVYDVLNPDKARFTQKNRLSAYLGRRNAG
jgi:soluble lytic murein transglycosylase